MGPRRLVGLDPAHTAVAGLTGRLSTGGETFWRTTDTYPLRAAGS